jgi:N-acylneuraminate cytidylyltransferase
MSVVAFIPVRCGSKSITLKNIKNFSGKPLVYWNLQALQECSLIDKIFVATDCDQIETVVKSLQFSKVYIYRRKPENATDNASTESVMLEFIASKEGQLSVHDVFLLVQATSPFTRTVDFTQALNLYHQNGYDSLLTCVRTKRFFWNPDGTTLNYDYTKRPRRQEFDGMLMENGAFYINTVQNIVDYKNRLCKKVGIYEMPEYTAIEIDEEEDWIIAEQLMNSKLKHV